MPKGSSERTAVLGLVRKTSRWLNYNNINLRFERNIAAMMETRNIAVLSYLPASDPMFAAAKAKWGSKGGNYSDRGIKGRRVQHRGKYLFFGLVGGKEMAIMEPGFRIGKL